MRWEEIGMGSEKGAASASMRNASPAVSGKGAGVLVMQHAGVHVRRAALEMSLPCKRRLQPLYPHL